MLKKNIYSYLTLLTVLVLCLNSISGQRCIQELPFNQTIGDIANYASGTYTLGNSNHLTSAGRSDLFVGFVDNEALINTTITNIYSPNSDVLIPGSISLGSLVPYDYPINYSFSGVNIITNGDAYSSHSFMSLYDQEIYNSILWSKRTISQTDGLSKCAHLENGDLIFMYNKKDAANNSSLCLSRITRSGTILWEKVYTLQREQGQLNNYSLGLDLLVLTNGNIAVSGMYGLDNRSLKTAFISIFRDNGRHVRSINFNKIQSGTNSVINTLVQAKTGDKDIYFMGVEESTSVSNLIFGSVSINGDFKYHKYSNNLRLANGDFIGSNDIAIMEDQNILGMSTTFYYSTSTPSSHNILYYYDIVLNSIIFHAQPIPNGNQKMLITLLPNNSSFLTARTTLESGSLNNITAEKFNNMAYSGCTIPFAPPSYIIRDLESGNRIRFKDDDISNLMNYQLERSYSFPSVDYCNNNGSGNLSKKIINNEQKVLPNYTIIESNDRIYFNIEDNSKSNGTIDLYSVDGKIITSNIEIKSSSEVDLSRLNQGVYFLIDKQLGIVKKIVR